MLLCVILLICYLFYNVKFNRAESAYFLHGCIFDHKRAVQQFHRNLGSFISSLTGSQRNYELFHSSTWIKPHNQILGL